jgi:hypothetical protein
MEPIKHATMEQAIEICESGNVTHDFVYQIIAERDKANFDMRAWMTTADILKTDLASCKRACRNLISIQGEQARIIASLKGTK